MQLTEDNFQALKDVSIAILEGRRKEHLSKSRTFKAHSIYIKLTPGNEDAPAPELIVERTLGDSTISEALFHASEANRFNLAIQELQDTTYEESS